MDFSYFRLESRTSSRAESRTSSRTEPRTSSRAEPRTSSRAEPQRDGEESVDETRREIAMESERIRREMDRERRSKSPTTVRDRSPTRTYLTLTASPKTLMNRDRPDAGGRFLTNSSRDNSTTGGHKSLSDFTNSSRDKSTTRGRKSLSDEEKEMSAELKATQNALEVTQNALYDARKSLKETQAVYEDARTQLMLSEYKKDNTSKELARLSDDLKRKRQEALNVEQKTKSRLDELKEFDAIGFTKEEAMKIIEANETMKARLRNLDAIHAERDELIQQLESTKQELFHEQKKSRTSIEELKEEMENLTSTYEQMQTEKDEAMKKVQRLEQAYKKMEKEKNELVQEKTRQYEEERDKNKTDRTELKRRSHEDMEQIRHELIKMTRRVTSLQDDVSSKDEINLQLRDQLLDFQQRAEQEHTSRSSIVDDHKKTLHTLRKETDAAMVQLRESLFLEKQKTVDKLREDLEHEKREITARASERYESQIADQAAIIKAKSAEISHLSRLIEKLESDQTRNTAKIEEEIKMQVQESVNREKKLMDQEKDWTIRQERENLESEHRYAIKQVQDELTKERERREKLETRLKEVGDELDDVRAANKSAVHEKLIAVARAKELMRQEQQAELDRIKEQLKNEHKKEIEKLREIIRVQEEELRQLRAERMYHLRQQKESSISLDRTERTLINEINDECRKTSEVLGLSPRKVTINSYRENGYSSTPPPLNNSTAPIKAPTTSALPSPPPRADQLFLFTQAQEVCRANEANLRACNEEMRVHVSDLQHELELQRNTANSAAREKEEAISNLKRQMDREKQEEMERLKEKLVRGLSTNEYRSLLYTPDNDVAMRQQQNAYQMKSHPMDRQMRQMSDDQQRDLDRLEREVNKLAMGQGEGRESDDVVYTKNLAQLQAKVKQLQTENNTLRRSKLAVTTSTPDLSNPDLYNGPNHRKFLRRSPSPTRDQQRLASPSPTRDQQRLASAMELRTRDHDLETEALTGHQKRNRDVMSRKMAEMSKLQNTLTNQAKELINLEKSYTQLNNFAKGRSSLR